MLTPGSDSTLASKKAGLNVLKQFLLSTHDHKPDGSRGKEYETDPDILKPEVFCTEQFWQEFGYYVTFIYSGRSKRATAYKPLTIAEYMRKAFNVMKEKHSGTSATIKDLFHYPFIRRCTYHRCRYPRQSCRGPNAGILHQPHDPAERWDRLFTRSLRDQGL